ncbi:hypothetical protein ADL19_02395 [Streptomyces purpurogeneiscleroticus]|jgi:hypothetical protein|nr:hypothetical protein ADL19_02395 [Streptomyces purpurogeneiscleroticus]
MATKPRKSHLVRQDVERFRSGTDARSWAEYRQAQYKRVLIGIQPDLFGAPVVEVFRPSPKMTAPETGTPEYEVEMFHGLPPEKQALRLAADPQTPFARTTRGSSTEAEKAALIVSAANWLRVGQPVRIAGAPLTLDGDAGRRVGHTGVVWRLCRPAFADHAYVNLDLIGAERSEKVVFVELCDVEPIEAAAFRAARPR